ncbi:hypothetical protein AAHC03_05363 [Spirometra sp. Aus1]
MLQFAFKALSSPDNGSARSKIKNVEKISAVDAESTLQSVPVAPTSSLKRLEANARSCDLDSPEVPDDLGRSKIDESFDSSRDISLSSDAVSKLLKPVKEKSFSKEAEEVRITKLYRLVLRISSESTSSGLVIKPLLENIVESFVLRCLPLPPHLTSIKFASCKLLANCCMKDNELNRALRLLIQAIQLDSTDLSLWFKVASASIKLCQTELATSALLHILNERPSHPFALHLALPFFLGISELETCLELSVRTLLMDPADEAATYCIQRVLQLQPSLEYLVERVLISEPNLLSLPLSEELKREMDSRVSETRDGYLKQLQNIHESKRIKTVKFPKPLSSVSWECLTAAVVELFDLLDAEQAINSVLDLASLFPDGVFPEQRTRTMEATASPADQEVSPSLGDLPSSNTGSQPRGKEETDSSDNLLETDEASASPVVQLENQPDVVLDCENKPRTIPTENPSDGREDRNTKARQEYESVQSLSLSRARRNRRIAAEKWRLGAASLGHDSSPASGLDPFISADGTALSSRRIRTGGSASHRLHQRHDHRSHHKQKWIDLATTLRSLLPASYREIAHTFEQEYLENHEGLPRKAVVDEDCPDRPSTLEESKCCVVGRDRQQQEIESESSLVMEFLRILQNETVNVVTLGVALLLQLSSVEKPWDVRLATAYLELSTRIRPSLPAWSPNYIGSNTEEQCHAGNCGTYQLLPASLIRLRSRPSPSQQARLHLTYLEVRLDALAYQSSFSRHAPSEAPLSAFENAVLADSKRFNTSDQTIPHHDLTLLLRAIGRLPEDSPEARILQIRVVWMNYELSSLAHDYESMREYLLQVREFVSQYGPFHRASSTRNHLISPGRICELLSEVDDRASGDKLIALSNVGDFEALISSFEEYLRSRSRANRSLSSPAFRSGLHCDQLSRISSILHPPLIELHRRISEITKQLCNPNEDEEKEDADIEESTITAEEQRQLEFVLRCYSLGLRTISFLLSNTVSFERLSAFKILPEDQKTALDKALHLGTVALDLLVRCWDAVVSVMSAPNFHLMFAQEKSATEGRLPANILAQSNLLQYSSEYVSGNHEKIPTVCESPSAGQVPLSLTFGHVCSGLRLSIDWLAWRLKAVGVLGLHLPPMSLSLVASLYEMSFRLESDLPLDCLPDKLATYRALMDLQKTPEDSLYHSQLRDVLRSAQPGYVLCLARGHAPSPPSLSLLHVCHELLASSKASANPAQIQSSDTTTSAASSLTAPHAGPCPRGPGLRLLRHSILRFAERMQALSLAYQSLTVQDWFSPVNSFAEDTSDGGNYDEKESSTGSSGDIAPPIASTHSGTTEMCTGLSSTASNYGTDHGIDPEETACWPVGSIKMGEALAQAVHCICGLKITPSVAPLTSSSRFKVASPRLLSPPPAAGSCVRNTNVCLEGEDGECELLSYVTPTPLWLTDAALFLDTVEDHWLPEDGVTNNPSRSGVWWDGSPSKLDWQIAEAVFLFYHPSVVPEYDSLKTMSISSELSGWLTEVVKLLPGDIEAQLIPEDQIKLCMNNRVELPRHNFSPSSLLTLMYYLLGDYHMKNNNFHLAVDFYVRDLRVEPRHADSWASLALIYSSQLEQILNMTDLRTERVSSRSVTTCLRCFEVAIELQPNFVTLLTERGCLAYQLHSYAARLLKKAETRTFQEAHLNVCRNWHHKMLNLAFTSYCTALSLQASGRRLDSLTNSPQREKVAASGAAEQEEEGGGDSGGGSPFVDEEWLYFYMLTKCAEKAGPGGLFLPQYPTKPPSSPASQTMSLELNSSLESYADWVMRIVSCYQHTADVLQAAGAKYPRKIVVYNKLPYLAVEAVEVFYRAHAFALKVLLQAGKPQSNSTYKLPLVELYDALLKLSQSAFVVESGKNGRNKNRKRPTAPPSNGCQPEDSSPCKLSKCNSEQAAALSDLPTGDDPPQTAVSVDAVALACNVDPPKMHPAGEDASTSTAQTHVQVTTDAPDQPKPVEEISAVLSNLDLWLRCIDRCREALELVLRRLPLHYKCMYRLAHLHFTLESDLDKSMAIMMGPFDHVTKVELGGLFKDRRQSNFFHGVWRIPTSDIDRSGNFAAHMYRSTSLVLEVLEKRGDWRRLLQVFHQLRKQPPEDKRGFLSEADRVFLARRAFNLVYPALRLWLSDLASRMAPIGPGGAMRPVTTSVEALRSANLVTVDTLSQIYRLHCVAKSRCADDQPQKTPTNAPLSANNTVAAGFAELLSLAYHLCPDAWDASGPSISTEAVLKRCSELTPQSPSKASTTGQRVNLPLQGPLSNS